METKTALIIAAAVLAAAAITTILIKKRRAASVLTLFEGAGANVSKSGEEALGDAKLVEKLKEIIKNSEDLKTVVGASGEKKKIYDKILSDIQLVAELKKAKDQTQARQILLQWAQHYTHGEKTLDKAPVKNLPKKRIMKTQGKSDAKEQPLPEQPKEQTPTISPKDKRTVQQIEELLKINNLEKFIELVQKLNSNQIQQMIKFYQKSESTSRIELIFKRAGSAREAKQILKSQATTKLEEEYDRLKDAISKLRRRGESMQHESLALMKIPQKIRMFGVTFSKSDFEKVKNAMLEINAVIQEKQKKYDQEEKRKQQEAKAKAAQLPQQPKATEEPKEQPQKNTIQPAAQTPPPAAKELTQNKTEEQPKPKETRVKPKEKKPPVKKK